MYIYIYTIDAIDSIYYTHIHHIDPVYIYKYIARHAVDPARLHIALHHGDQHSNQLTDQGHIIGGPPRQKMALIYLSISDKMIIIG